MWRAFGIPQSQLLKATAPAVCWRNVKDGILSTLILTLGMLAEQEKADLVAFLRTL
jgi:hypothetical protein